ncbi:hypothetical protein Nepgr_016973 [Nepenthes gracilis]|uniref:Uncharacterized protein n=1 Tax=Nepenthes gracilis TaxID=150966 RepID=A0AAD3XRS1_NEPGR|nr:hypothetical protein Nepgr_016973 [Nepenthes gracilis]
MEKALESPIKGSNQRENMILKLIENDNYRVKAAGMVTPDRLKLPKSFKYPERYTSPTDLMISPISKGLLERSRKTGVLLPSPQILSRIQDLQPQDKRQIQLKLDECRV